MEGEAQFEVGARFWGDEGAGDSEPDRIEVEPLFTIPPVSGFWRRFAAFLLDGMLLGIVGQVLGWSMSSVWFQLGPYGRIVGQLVALAYFGLMDSSLAGGQTLGKRALRVAVRDAEGQPIGVGRSMLRTLVWLIPVTLNGWALPEMTNPIVSWVTGVILFGVGGAVLVTMVFNRRSRQGLQDMLTRTYVLHLGGQPVEALPVAARIQWVLSCAMLVLAVVVAGVSGLLVSQAGSPLQQVLALQKTLQQDNRFFSSSVFDQTFYESDGQTSRALRIQVWYRGVPTESQRSAVMNDVARAALTVKDVDSYDLVRIDVTSAYDLGFATGYLTYGDGQPASTWRERVSGQ